MQKIKSSGGILAEILKKVKSPENVWSKFWRKLRARLKIPRLPDLKGGVLNSNTPVIISCRGGNPEQKLLFFHDQN